MKLTSLVKAFAASTVLLGSGFATPVLAAGCGDLPNHAALTAALKASVAPAVTNGGFDLNMWATIVDRDGKVCHVSMSGNDRGGNRYEPSSQHQYVFQVAWHRALGPNRI